MRALTLGGPQDAAHSFRGVCPACGARHYLRVSDRKTRGAALRRARARAKEVEAVALRRAQRVLARADAASRSAAWALRRVAARSRPTRQDLERAALDSWLASLAAKGILPIRAARDVPQATLPEDSTAAGFGL